MVTIDVDVNGGEKGTNVDVGEERDVGGDEEEKVGNPNDEDDNDEDEWFYVLVFKFIN